MIGKKNKRYGRNKFTSTTTTSSKPFEIVKKLLKKYNPDDIFILAPSVKSVKTPVRKLENKIKTELENVPIYVPNNDDESIDKSIIENISV